MLIVRKIFALHLKLYKFYKCGLSELMMKPITLCNSELAVFEICHIRGQFGNSVGVSIHQKNHDTFPFRPCISAS